MIPWSLKRGGFLLLGEGVLECNHKIEDEKPHSNQSKQLKTNGYYARKYNQHLYYRKFWPKYLNKIRNKFTGQKSNKFCTYTNPNKNFSEKKFFEKTKG